jgi:hypothetical protein
LALLQSPDSADGSIARFFYQMKIGIRGLPAGLIETTGQQMTSA